MRDTYVVKKGNVAGGSMGIRISFRAHPDLLCCLQSGLTAPVIVAVWLAGVVVVIASLYLYQLLPVVVLSGSRFRLAAALFAAPHLADAADPMVVAVS